MPEQAAPITAHLNDGTTRTLTREERQYVEPSAYNWEAGWWAVDTDDGRLYFVSDDGRVDLHDADTFACLEEGIGATPAAREAYWREQAEEEHRRTFPPVLCPACTGTGYETTDPEDASRCLDCNGTGKA